MEGKITGIGGVFFKSDNAQETREWYNQMLGFEAQEWGKTFPWIDINDKSTEGYTVWNVFKRSSDYFGDSNQTFMVNYIVQNMDDLLAKLEQQGVYQVKPMEDSEFGKFAWINDINGQRIELWEPK